MAAIWVLQIGLAAVMLFSGVCKSVFPRERLLQMGQSGVAGLSLPTLRCIGIVEVLGGLGLVLPPLLGLWRGWVPLAALGFAVIMALAFGVHSRLMGQASRPEVAHREARNRINNVVLGVVALLIVAVRTAELLG